MGERNPRGRMPRKGRGLGELCLRTCLLSSHGSNSLLLLLWKLQANGVRVWASQGPPGTPLA